MPSPIAHPAAALPFVRYGLPLSALIIGSLAPDAGYLFDFSTPFYMYTLEGLIFFDVPIGLVMLFGFHWLIKYPLLSLLPPALQGRLITYARGFKAWPLKQFGLAVAAMFVGAFSHVLWDGFTHPYGIIAEHTTFFLQRLDNGMPLYDVLQEISTVVGFIIVLIWFIQWLWQAPKSTAAVPQFSLVTPRFFYILWALSVLATSAAIFLVRYMDLLPVGRGRFRYSIFGGISLAILLTMIEIGIYCFFWTVKFYKSLRAVN
jgi:hypothetical protein